MITDLFGELARSSAELIAHDDVVARWDAPSALEGYAVGGLAGHLARGVLTVEQYLDAQPPDDDRPRTDAAGYFVAVLGQHDPHTSKLHEAIRQRAEERSAVGAEALAAEVREAGQRLARRLRTLPLERPIEVLDGVVLELGDYLETRLVELVIHLDDLAVSAGHRAATVPDDALALVASVLARIAVSRTGGWETVRSLARRERHPDPVRAL